MNKHIKNVLLAASIFGITAIMSNASQIQSHGRGGYTVVASPKTETSVAVYTGHRASVQNTRPHQAVHQTIQTQGRSGYAVRDSR